MKQISWLVSLLLLATVFPSCREDEPAKPGNIRFALNPTVVNDGQGRKATSLPDGASVYVTIRRVSGDEVYTLQHVRLLKLGDEYISEPLPLAGGNYELTDFLVADGDGNVVYAAPKEGSELASWVDDPLPQTFAVSDNDITPVTVQVLPTDAHQPEQFGYVTFHVDVVPLPRFQLSVFRADGTALVFSPAHVYILSDGDTIYHRHLPAGTQPIDFAGEPGATYTLVVQEDALMTYSRTFVLVELLSELNGAPLQVTLDAAFTFTALARTDFFSYWLTTDVTVPDAFFTINWGDGTVEDYTVNTYLAFEHRYGSHGDYHVSMSGDLTTVRWLALVFGYGLADDISLQALPGLESISVSYSDAADTLDVSHNPNLQMLAIAHSTIQYVDIRHNPKLTFLDVTANTALPASVLNQLITDLHHNAVEQHIEQGELYLETSYDSGEILGPPSSDAMAMLVYLNQTLGWTVRPSPGI
ncbi:hypothetical protein KK062_26420 [Fulvivirgaceae bacterium PWU5]|uniref:PKD domain-containing protein n=1 Tax=Dawidia cretensis TaxID=2782350 RepID=A0AAP2E435_9BACT|nr:hypothetical protein [Dawidia cretensis]MBT1711804.1 hypothetical protein [Dawidia cretensis]